MKLENIIELFNKGLYESALIEIDQYKPTNQNEKIQKNIIKIAILIRSGNTALGLQNINELWKEEVNRTAELYNLKGIALRTKGELNDALEIFKEGFSKYKNSVDLAHNLSITATDLSNYEMGIEYAKIALEINPKFKETLKNLAKIYITLRDVDNARKILHKLKKISQNSIDAIVGEGALDLIENNPKNAIKKFKKALKINPKTGPALGNLGVSYKFIGDYKTAKKFLQDACLYEVEQVEHHWNLALVKLALGEYREGWKEYEIRYDKRRIATDKVALPKTTIPMLNKTDDIKGKSIVILQEQGFGDTFQFLRFAENLKNEGAREIIAIVSKEIAGVIKTIPWIDKVKSDLKDGETLPDFWVFPMSLPYRYEINTPEEIQGSHKYIKIEKNIKDYWNKKLNNLNKKIRVGLIWAGRESHTNDSNRSIKLETLKTLAKFQNEIDFISLQKGDKENQDAGIEWKITRLGNELNSFQDTSGLLSNIDLLISIDSGPVHLAGAMGMPVWVLIPKIFDFRWLIDREDTPWYSSMHLFRQKQNEKWENVIVRIEKNLQKFISEYKTRWEPDILKNNHDLTFQENAGIKYYLEIAYLNHLKGEYREAIEGYKMICRYDEKNIEARRNLASALRSTGKKDESLILYKQLEKENVQDSIMYSNYSNLLFELGMDKEGLSKKEIAEKIKNSISLNLNDNINKENISNNNISEKLKNIINLIEKDKANEAEILLEQIANNSDKNIEFLLTAGYLYQVLEKFDLSENYYEKATALDSNNQQIYINKAVLYANQLKYDDAIKTINKCLELNPENSEARFHRSLYLLTLEKWKIGWKEYEWRMDPRRTAKQKVQIPNLRMPMWRGEKLANKIILLIPEQGYGDYIQFIRFAYNLKMMGARVIAGCHEPLKKIIRNCQWIDEVAGHGESVTYHYWTFPMSLPYRLEIDPSKDKVQFPYLFASKVEVEKWINILNIKKINLNKPIVLLNCSGSKNHIRDKQRNIDVNKLNEILNLKNIQFISINKKNDNENELNEKKENLVEIGSYIENFSDTAALISLSKLLISVDSAPIHLAGAMNKECWALIDYLPDFRWGLEKKSTYWYKSLSLYRKENSKSWESTITKLKNDLKNRFIE